MKKELAEMWPWALSCARRLLHGYLTVDPEDVVQDAYLRALRKLSRYRGEAELASWFFKVIETCCVNAVRRQIQSRCLSLEKVTTPVAGKTKDIPDPFARSQLEGMIASEEVAYYARQIESLNPRLKVAMLLFCVEGQSYSEVSERLGIPTTAVKARLARARRKIRKAKRYGM